MILLCYLIHELHKIPNLLLYFREKLQVFPESRVKLNFSLVTHLHLGAVGEKAKVKPGVLFEAVAVNRGANVEGV